MKTSPGFKKPDALFVDVDGTLFRTIEERIREAVPELLRYGRLEKAIGNIVFPVFDLLNVGKRGFVSRTSNPSNFEVNDGIVGVMRYYHSEGKKVEVLTSNPRDDIKKCLKNNGLGEFKVNHAKNKPAFIDAYMEMNPGEKTVVVSDGIREAVDFAREFGARTSEFVLYSNGRTNAVAAYLLNRVVRTADSPEGLKFEIESESAMVADGARDFASILRGGLLPQACIRKKQKRVVRAT